MFASRKEAGHWLARTLEVYRRAHPVVLGVPDGGVPVAREVSECLDAPLDAVVVQRVPAPGLLDLTLATLTEDGTYRSDDDLIDELGIKPDELDLRLQHQRVELEARVQRIRGDRRPMDLEGRTAIVVHDGIETDSAAEATVSVARRRGAARVVLATPVSSREALERLGPQVDDLVCLRAWTPLGRVGFWYADRWEGGDGDVAQALREHAERPRTPEPPGLGAFGEDQLAGFSVLMAGLGWLRLDAENQPVPAPPRNLMVAERRRRYVGFP